MEISTFEVSITDDESFEAVILQPPGEFSTEFEDFYEWECLRFNICQPPNAEPSCDGFFWCRGYDVEENNYYYTNGGMNERTVEPWLKCEISQRFNNGYKGQINGFE